MVGYIAWFGRIGFPLLFTMHCGIEGVHLTF